MDEGTMRQRAEAARVGRLATVGGDGAPHLVPVCYTLLGETVYSAVDHKPKRRGRLRRVANLQETGRACLLVDEYDEDWARLWWVRLDGRGRIVEDPVEADRAVAALTAKYPQYQARPPEGPVIAVDVQKWSSWSASEPASGRSGGPADAGVPTTGSRPGQPRTRSPGSAAGLR